MTKRMQAAITDAGTCKLTTTKRPMQMTCIELNALCDKLAQDAFETHATFVHTNGRKASELSCERCVELCDRTSRDHPQYYICSGCPLDDRPE